MPKDIHKEEVNPGKVVFEWTVKEYEEQERERRWYYLMGVIAVALIVYALVSQNYLFALVVVLFGIILFLQDIQKPKEIYFALTESGMIVSSRFYRFSEIKNFWLIYNPPTVKSLYFTLNSLVKHRLQIPLLDYDPRPIRDFLSQYLEEDLEQEDEPVSDKLGRILKLH